MLSKGIYAALASALFLGLAPVFGKLAIKLGLSPLSVVSLRTAGATMLVFIVIMLTKRRYLYIYPAGLLGCLIAGSLNGLGSLFFYAALARIDASLGQLLYALYPLFLVIWLWFDNQPPSRLTLFRLFLIIPGLYLLTLVDHGHIDLVGVVMMLAASALYALHLPINQRVLYDMPAQTVTFYTLLAMSAVVIPAFFIAGTNLHVTGNSAWWSVFALTVVTFLSRLALFFGVKHLGGMQTAILGLGELIIALFFSYLWLGERLSVYQWIGALILLISLGLIFLDNKKSKARSETGWLSWLHPPVITKDVT
jgi:drug/metabolite transporter (DMT)-like permease